MLQTLSPLGLTPRTVFAIGRNFAEHARELGNAVPAAPVVFLKPLSALAGASQPIRLPAVGRIDHEVEIVVAIGKGGRHIAPERAQAHIAGYAVGIDVTARDLQEDAKRRGLPWTVAKGYDTFAPLGAFVGPEAIGDGPLGVSLTVNGQLRQRGDTSQMIFPIPQLIAYLSTVFTLQPGDLIFTGTPSGVGPLAPGDRLVATLGEDLARLEISVTLDSFSS
jgi:2-keto-4-pentenoate hydratase/2-oxohepta-3-ene-1,7-dioic acid hydratase in catechol pathway